MRATYAGFALVALQALTNNVNAQADRARGEKLFGECVACHSLERGIQAVGPSLYGVLGRRAAALDEFRYSPAIKRSGITWSRDTIDAYVADPQKAIPANRMPYAGMPEAKDRADVIEYIVERFK